MRFRVTHRTSYAYDIEVSASYNEVRMAPRTLPHQRVLASALHVDPVPADQRERTDYFGNRVTFLSIQQPHRSLVLAAVSEVDVTAVLDLAAPTVDDPWETVRARGATVTSEAAIDARQFLLDSPLVAHEERHRAFAAPSFPTGRPALEAVRDLVTRIHDEFEYRPGSTTVATGLDVVLDQRSGVCQDFAHVGIAAVRAMGLPARYVSGYLETRAPAGGEKLVGVDASHAWFSVFLEGRGWVDLDPTNDQVPDERYLTTAWGRDYGDVTPVKGIVYSPGHRHALSVAVDVERLDP